MLYIWTAVCQGCRPLDQGIGNVYPPDDFWFGLDTNTISAVIYDRYLDL